jgi:heterodisulfide reductase subunit B
VKYAYYPGCSGGATAREYSQSSVEVSRRLGVELAELSDWNCCGASSAHQTNHTLMHSLTGRNLARAERDGLDMAFICPACYIRMKDTCLKVKENVISKDKMADMIGAQYSAGFDVSHLLDIIVNRVGLEAVRKQVVKPLTGLKVVSYYGCYLVRPRELTGFDDAENPLSMDSLMSALGAEALDWGGKVECCGGSGSFTDKGAVRNLVRGIMDSAREVGADLVVTACGLCQSNLESRQSGGKNIPVVYFTELMGLAFGMDAGRWFRQHLVSPAPVLKEYGLA